MNSVISKPSKRTTRPRLNLSLLHEELVALRQRVEDLEDLRELNQAIERNGSKPLVPWASARRQLGLE